MSPRVLALFLAFVLLWSGVSVAETLRCLALPSPAQPHALAQAGEQGATPGGSVEHHYQDGLPLQALSDPAAETPGLLPAPLKPEVRTLALVHLRAPVAAGVESPFLAGPLRPPCPAAHMG